MSGIGEWKLSDSSILSPFLYLNTLLFSRIRMIPQLDQLSVEQAYLCPDLSFNLLLRRPLTRQEECTRGLSEPPLFTNGR